MTLAETVDAGAAVEETTAPPVADDTSATSTSPPPSEQTDQAAGRTEATAETEPEGGSAAAGESTEEEKALLASLPPELRKNFNRVFTQKAQALAAKRKEAEASLQLVKLLNERPEETIAALQQGLAKRGSGNESKATAADTTVDEARQVLEAEFGPEVAAKLLPTFEKLAKSVVSSAIQPLQQEHEKRLMEAVSAQTQTALEAAASRHPDWAIHEERINELAETIQVSPDTPVERYLDMLYTLASSESATEQRAAAIAKKSVDRMTRSAAVADTPASTVPTARVAVSARQVKSFEEAFDLARRGITVEE